MSDERERKRQTETETIKPIIDTKVKNLCAHLVGVQLDELIDGHTNLLGQHVKWLDGCVRVQPRKVGANQRHGVDGLQRPGEEGTHTCIVDCYFRVRCMNTNTLTIDHWGGHNEATFSVAAAAAPPLTEAAITSMRRSAERAWPSRPSRRASAALSATRARCSSAAAPAAFSSSSRNVRTRRKLKTERPPA